MYILYHATLNILRKQHTVVSDSFNVDFTALIGNLQEYLPLKVLIADKSDFELLWDHMVKQYHYIGYQKIIGSIIKYLVYYQNRPTATVSYNCASLKVGVRDTYIGWNMEQKRYA